MKREIVGKVTEDEKREIRRLYERRCALKELYITLASPYLSEEERKVLYEKICDDMERTISQYDDWWRQMPEKYSWKRMENGCWTVNFETNEVYLEDQEGDSCKTGICSGLSCA